MLFGYLQINIASLYTCECARAKLIYCSEETKREWTCGPFLLWVVGASKSNTVTQLLMIRQQIHSALTMVILLKCKIIRNEHIIFNISIFSAATHQVSFSIPKHLSFY